MRGSFRDGEHPDHAGQQHDETADCVHDDLHIDGYAVGVLAGAVIALGFPMPDIVTVVVVNVEPGSVVARGDVLVVLEAMKMELPVKAPRDGRVRAIHCRAGALVQPGSPLVELA